MSSGSLVELAADQLSRDGWWVADNWLSPELSMALQEEARQVFNSGQFKQAKIGRGQQKILRPNIRSDQTYWLEGKTEPQQAFMQAIDDLRLGLNRYLFLGLQRSEAHYAVYQPGAFYQRHSDNFDGSSPRMVTFTYYLNQGWQPEDGGALRLYTGAQIADANILPGQLPVEAQMDVFPEMGRLVLFMSQVFPHEVMTTNRNRWSIAGWMRTDSADPLLAAIDAAS